MQEPFLDSDDEDSSVTVHPAPPNRLLTAHALQDLSLEGERHAGRSALGLAHGDFENAQDRALSLKPTRRVAMLVTAGVFGGYAALNVLQAKLKARIGIRDSDEAASNEFSFACSMLYTGNLVFRLLHNVVFACLTPRVRVLLALVLMTASMATCAVVIMLLHVQHISMVFLAYGLGGVAIGTFEGNILSYIAPLGHGTKTWAIVGLPVGYNVISIMSFVFISLDPNSIALQAAQYGLVVVGLCLGAFCFLSVLPDPEAEVARERLLNAIDRGDDLVLGIRSSSNFDTAASVSAHSEQHSQHDFWTFVADLKSWREWLHIIKFCAPALLLDMLCVSVFSSVMLYIYDKPTVSLFGGDRGPTISKDVFFAIFNVFNFAGDAISRKVVYLMKPRNPLVFLVSTAVGCAACLSKVGILAWPGIFCVLFGNGAIYASATRHIDSCTPPRFNLTALSMFLFIGDWGSVIGSNVLYRVRELVGPA